MTIAGGVRGKDYGAPFKVLELMIPRAWRNLYPGRSARSSIDSSGLSQWQLDYSQKFHFEKPYLMSANFSVRFDLFTSVPC